MNAQEIQKSLSDATNALRASRDDSKVSQLTARLMAENTIATALGYVIEHKLANRDYTRSVEREVWLGNLYSALFQLSVLF